ncbi:unnamed protein product [Oikopleura dioica]|uniref:Uncharacterized protein n=1 Tax=Oikopleura dioica TaxID=34765 RepID=E4YVQ8_OIKDI|nr:unnamed protein product [Oikopleura dioica]
MQLVANTFLHDEGSPVASPTKSLPSEFQTCPPPPPRMTSKPSSLNSAKLLEFIWVAIDEQTNRVALRSSISTIATTLSALSIR